MCISLDCVYIYCKNDTLTFQCHYNSICLEGFCKSRTYFRTVDVAIGNQMGLPSCNPLLLHPSATLRFLCRSDTASTCQTLRSYLPVNPLAPNDVYMRRTAQLTSRRCILNIYSTNILTEYSKHAAHSPFFFFSRCRLFHNGIFFGSCNIHILNTECAKILKKIPAPKS